jgi:hypothetical protein
MGTLYYAVCHDCAEVLCLGKFWDWRTVRYDTPPDELEREIEEGIKELFDYFNCDDVGNVGDRAGRYRDEWIRCAAYVLGFLSVHNGHRIAIVDEHSDPYRTIGTKILGVRTDLTDYGDLEYRINAGQEGKDGEDPG